MSKKINTQVKYRHLKILLKYSDYLYFFTSHLWEEVNINIVSKHKYFFTYYPKIQKTLRNSDCKTRQRGQHLQLHIGHKGVLKILIQAILSLPCMFNLELQ